MDTAFIKTTACCSLAQITAKEYTLIKELRERIRTAYNDGYRAIFTIVRWDEPTLAVRLAKLGFKKGRNFRRSDTHECKRRPLTMWTLAL